MSKSITPPDFGPFSRNYYNLTLQANAEDIEAGGGLPIARAIRQSIAEADRRLEIWISRLNGISATMASAN